MVNNYNCFINNYSAKSSTEIHIHIMSNLWTWTWANSQSSVQHPTPKSIRNKSQRAYETRAKEHMKQEPKSVHVASRTNLYYLNETKSMNVQVKFPKPFPFANFRVRFFCFVALPFRCICIPFRCVCIPFRCVCLPFRCVCIPFRCVYIPFVAFAFRCEAFCGVCAQLHLHTTNCKAVGIHAWLSSGSSFHLQQNGNVR